MTSTVGAMPTTDRVTMAYPLMSSGQVEALIAEGRHIIVVDQYVLKVDAWLPYHPGGDISIKHMVGRDATDEVNAFHGAETRCRMERYRIGRIEGRWKNLVPPIQGGIFPSCATKLSPASNSSSQSSSKSLPPSPSSSSPPSTVSDDDGETLHWRGRSGKLPARPLSVSSVSSVVSEEADIMTYLDTETRKGISLDLNLYPSLEAETQQSIVDRYRELDERIRARGLFNCNYGAYAIEAVRYTTAFLLMLIFLHSGHYLLSGLCLGFFWHQLAFAVHDAGHLGITHDLTIDTLIGIFAADFLGGLSVCWWKRNHNVHHIVTNAPEHDPDIEHMPFFAISHRFLSNLRSTYYDRVMDYDWFARAFLKAQAWLYYPIMTFGRFNLYYLSWDHLLANRGSKKGPAWWHRRVEIVGQVFFWTWFGYGIVYRCIPTSWDRFVFFLVSHMATSPLHVQITLSHFAMSTADLGPQESFPQRMLRTTMDVDCPQWLDFIHGGLQFQVIHHLFPRMPRHNLREAQKLVQEFCRDVSIPYALYGFADGNGQVIGRLAEVSRQAAIFAKCQQALAKGEVSGH